MSEPAVPIVVPWDFSNHAKAALRYARQQFANPDIHVLCVLEAPNPYEIGFQWGVDSEQEAAQKCAEDFAKEAGVQHASETEFECRFGDPADEIARYAKSVHAEFIVMSTHGRTGLQKLVLGSVAQKVITRASCPVILLPNHWYESNDKQIEKADG
ncbi:universal stress protein [Mariniblastus fucicola]|uniref:universal stress protein n=1 Tax=Mariniblastus fucicola TaxID=980251 RepID=UPI0012FB6E4C|nr:universal stress protein [Mariniblastus fucicola]